jgi:2-polyprenyl-3-methyl-5-hydroxy-6-metoxy-1,4-benzoquinol methylase
MSLSTRQSERVAPGRRPAGVTPAEITGLVRLGADGLVSRAYGTLYDYIFERFPPYQALRRQIVERMAATTGGRDRRDVSVLDLMCGPGSLSLALAEEGFTVLGAEPFPRLLQIARRNVRTRGRVNVSFAPISLIPEAPAREFFDQVVNVHSLYAHPEPAAVLDVARESLKPGGHAIFVNFTGPLPLWSSLFALAKRDGLRAAAASLLWLFPHAVFEVTRNPRDCNFWPEDEFVERLEKNGFVVLEMRRTFFEDISLLAWVRKP